jgi:hypothetical protein
MGTHDREGEERSSVTLNPSQVGNSVTVDTVLGHAVDAVPLLIEPVPVRTHTEDLV